MERIVRKTCRRYDIPGHAHELTFSCFRNQPLLDEHQACEELVQSIGRARQRHHFDLWGYVFMPDHVHLLLFPTEPTCPIAAVLRSIKQPVARKLLLHFREQNPTRLRACATGQKHDAYRFWQAGGGYDRNITSRRVLLKSMSYIHANPVKAGLVDDPIDWPWSSALKWEKPGGGPLAVDRDSFPVV